MSAFDRPQVLHRKIDCNQGAVRAVRYNVDGNYCITCGSDKTVKLWNPIKGILLKTYTGTGNEVLDAASSSDNSQILCGGMDKCLNIYDVETGKMLRRWRAHAAKVNAVAFNEESNVAFSGSLDTTMNCFDARSRNEKPIQTFNEGTDSILSININAHELVVGCADSFYRTYNIRDGWMTQDFMGESVSSVQLTPDGNCVLASTHNSPLRLMDKSNGKLLASYTGHTSATYRVEGGVLHNMEYVLSGSEDGFVYVYGVVDGSVAVRLHHPEAKVIHSLSTHPKLAHVISTTGPSIYLWTPKPLDEDAL